jgi:hypothetical protein
VTLKGRTWVLIGAGVAAVIGAILAFALHNPDKAVAGLNLDSLGLVLMTAALIVLAGWAVDLWWTASPRRRQGPASSPTPPSGGGGGIVDLIRTVGGLIAVMIAIGAVVTVFIVAVSLNTDLKPESVVALATAGFGVISAVVGAYLGIKISSENNAAITKAQTATSEALVAQLGGGNGNGTGDGSGGDEEQLPEDTGDEETAGGEPLAGAAPRSGGAQKV